MRYFSFLFLALLLCTSSFAEQSAANVTNAPSYNPKQILIGIKARQPSSPRFTQFETSDLLRRLHATVNANIRVVRSFPAIGWQLVQLPENMTPEAAIKAYKEAFAKLQAELGTRWSPNSFEAKQLANSSLAAEVNGFVKLIEPVQKEPAHAEATSSGLTPRAVTPQAIIPNDPQYRDQGRYGVIQAPDAWSVSQGDGSVIVAIVDGGVDYRHPDLRDNMWPSHGYDPCTGGNEFPPDDHATHVAGIIGETGNNGSYGVGVNWKVTLVSIPMLTCGNDVLAAVSGQLKGLRTNAQVLGAYDWMIQQKRTAQLDIRVVNNSWINEPAGQAYDSQRAAIQAAGDAGILSVFAAGNLLRIT
jgi:subtilisin family serine protease